MPGRPDLSELLGQFPPRSGPVSWQATEASRGQVLARLLVPPFTFGCPEYHASMRRGLVCVLDWLRSQPGQTWQDRWNASGAEHDDDWRALPAQKARAVSGRSKPNRYKTDECSHGLTALICAEVIRPSLDWLLATPAPKNLAAAMARTRDPVAFSDLAAACEALARSSPQSPRPEHPGTIMSSCSAPS
jgi:hypothetical protein